MNEAEATIEIQAEIIVRLRREKMRLEAIIREKDEALKMAEQQAGANSDIRTDGRP